MDPAVLQHLPVFETLLIAIGLLVGATAAMLPSAQGRQRPAAPIFAFGCSVGALYGLLPICADSPRFPGVLALTLIGAAAGFASVYFVRREQSTPTMVPQTATSKIEALPVATPATHVKSA